MYTALTLRQFAETISYNYYGWDSKRPWEPKVGDYYTTPRGDCELYQILREDDDHFYTVYCTDGTKTESKWSKERFLKDFGINRIHVHDYILEKIRD